MPHDHKQNTLKIERTCIIYKSLYRNVIKPFLGLVLALNSGSIRSNRSKVQNYSNGPCFPLSITRHFTGAVTLMINIGACILSDTERSSSTKVLTELKHFGRPELGSLLIRILERIIPFKFCRVTWKLGIWCPLQNIQKFQRFFIR